MRKTVSKPGATRVRNSPPAGRPTREQARQRHAELLDRALEMFLEKGFELTTIDAIAASVGMTKRTVYARHVDKAALFRAAVQRAVERWIVPIDSIRAVETADLETTLIAVARLRLENAVSQAGIRLQRIIDAESYRFPDIHRRAYEQGTLPAVHYVGGLLQRHLGRDAVPSDKLELIGTSFLNVVVGGPVRGIVRGAVFEEAAITEHIRFCVHLFLNGIRPRQI